MEDQLENDVSRSRVYDLDIMMSRLATFAAERPGDTCKGLPSGFSGSYGDVRVAGLRIGDEELPLPVAVLRESAMRRNRGWMTAFLRATGVHLAPHGKTTMAPELFRMQMEDGAWGLTAATAQQLTFFAGLGVRRVILANQLVGPGNISVALDCAAVYPDLTFYCLVDSTGNVETLAAAARARRARPLNLLLEVGAKGGRTGLRSIEEALALARRIAAMPDCLTLSGIEAYEGIVPGASQAEREAGVAAMMSAVRELASACDAEDLFSSDEIVLTAGGTEFFDMAGAGLTAWPVKRRKAVVIRSGCYITHDSIAYERAFRRMAERSAEVAALSGSPEAALEVWAAIQSRPEPNLAFATLGKRDISHDWDMPVPLRWYRPGAMNTPQPAPPGFRVLRLNDQHAYLEVPENSSLAVGDLMGFGVSHACTTFDKWRNLLVVDDNYQVTGAIRTFF